MSEKTEKWSNSSVLRLADGGDPVEAITRRARHIVMAAMDEGWVGPPFDPLTLAAWLKLDVIPRSDVGDAQTVSTDRAKFRIEYNPNRPRGRLRFSVAHEIAHTLFDDCGERVRHRGAHVDLSGDDWQIEALCNIAASEILMPTGSLPPIKDDLLNVDALLQLRSQFDVSMESMFIRACRASDLPCAMFSATPTTDRIVIDYSIGSPSWDGSLRRGMTLPSESVVGQCTAIGFTAKGDETWRGLRGDIHVECVGVPPFPGTNKPRVVGIINKSNYEKRASQDPITYLKGSALEPRGVGVRFIVHVVNDATPNWGGRFAQGIRKQWPEVQSEFREWWSSVKTSPLGSVHVSRPTDTLRVASIVAQKGYGKSSKPRIRYAALEAGLTKIASEIAAESGSVHMPRIGCGEAGGSWNVVEELIRNTLGAQRLPVTVYDLPGAEPTARSAENLQLPL